MKYPGESNQQLRRTILANIVDAVKALQTLLIAFNDEEGKKAAGAAHKHRCEALEV